MKKAVSFIVAAALIIGIMGLAGCSIDYTTTVKKDGAISFVFDMDMNLSLLISAMGDDSLEVNDIVDVKDDNALKEFKKYGIDVSYKTYTSASGDKMFNQKITMSYSSIKDMENKMTELAKHQELDMGNGLSLNDIADMLRAYSITGDKLVIDYPTGAATGAMGEDELAELTAFMNISNKVVLEGWTVVDTNASSKSVNGNVTTLVWDDVIGAERVFIEATQSGAAAPAAPAAAPAKPAAKASANKTKIFIGDTQSDIAAYLIDGFNYLKLRDIAFLLKATDKKFEVGYNNRSGVISITPEKPYTAAGGELSLSIGEPKSITAKSQSILFNSKAMNIDAYNIDGYTYFKLRDITTLLDIEIVQSGNYWKLVVGK